MLRALSRDSASFLAYVCLLMAFASLGAFVAVLATGSRWATILGVVLIACLAGSVAGFRAAARTIARSSAMTEPGSAVSIFSTPLRQEQVDRYLANYRGRDIGPRSERKMTLLVGGEPTKREVPRERRGPALFGPVNAGAA